MARQKGQALSGAIKVGVIEEHEMLRRGIVSCLSEHSGIDVHPGGEDAHFREPPDVAVVSEAAARTRRFDCPLIVCTAGTDELTGVAPGNLVAGVLHADDITQVQLHTLVRAVAAGLRIAAEGLATAAGASPPARRGSGALPQETRGRVWVDEAHPIFRRGLVNSLQKSGFLVAGESAELAPEPDLARVDALIFDVDSVGLTRATALTREAGVPAIGLLWGEREDQLYDTLHAGLDGVLVRVDITPAKLAACVTAVLQGHGSVPPALLGRMLSELAHGSRRATSADGLAPRELDVLRLLSTGDSTREIADRLGYSERTVKNVVHELLVKMNCRTRAHAVALGMRQGII